MGGSSSSSTETSQTSYPQWTQDAQANTYGTGKGMLENFLRNPQYTVAGFTSDSLKGFDLARTSARNVFEAAPMTVPGAGGNLSPSLGLSATGSAAMGTAAQGQAAQLNPNAIHQFMNPYMADVVNPTMGRMRREYQNADAGLSAKFAAGGAFGGSGEAISRGQAARGYAQDAASTVGTLMAAGYDKATAAALANTQLQQQTNLANTQNQQQSGLANQAAQQQANMQNAGFQQQTGLANQSADNAMRALGLDYGLKSSQVNDQFRTSQLAREQTALERILQGGAMQEAKAQQALDIPWTALQRLMALTPQQMNSQTISNKETESNQSPMSMLTGGISALSGLKGLFGGV